MQEVVETHIIQKSFQVNDVITQQKGTRVRNWETQTAALMPSHAQASLHQELGTSFRALLLRG
jgi:hypothetical protein